MKKRQSTTRIVRSCSLFKLNLISGYLTPTPNFIPEYANVRKAIKLDNQIVTRGCSGRLNFSQRIQAERAVAAPDVPYIEAWAVS